MTCPAETSDLDAALAGARVLIVDDEPGMRNFLGKILAGKVAHLEGAGSTQEASRRLDAEHFDIVILDNLMPGGKGLDWLSDQRRRGFFADVILITAYADVDTAISALRAGVADFVLKPFRANQILGALARTLDRKALRRDNSLLRHALRAGPEHGPMLGTSAGIDGVRRMLQRLAPLPTPVLFTGPTGTGKELAARQLHWMSDLADRPFVAVNCAAIPPDRMTEDLFGVVGPDSTLKPGLFLLADGGVLFLDEVAQMPDRVQAALLRVLEDQRIRPQGAEREIPLTLRLCFATNADLPALVAEGRFREDLYHRINVMQVEMPPLQTRSEDIVELATHFMQQFSAALGLPPLTLDEETLLNMTRYHWPGNVRELKNLIERSVIIGAFPMEFAGQGKMTGDDASDDLEQVVQRHITNVVERCGGNRAEAARRLGVSRKTIDRRLGGRGE